MAFQAFCWHAPSFLLLRLPFFHAEVTSVPLAFTQRMRHTASLPFPLVLRHLRLLLPFPDGLWDLLPHCVPFRTVVKPVLFCAFLQLAGLSFTNIRPSNVEKSLLRPTSFQEDLPGHIAMLFSPILLHFLSQQSQPWFQSCSLFQLFVLMLGCPLLPAY